MEDLKEPLGENAKACIAQLEDVSGWSPIGSGMEKACQIGQQLIVENWRLYFPALLACLLFSLGSNLRVPRECSVKRTGSVWQIKYNI